MENQENRFVLLGSDSIFDVLLVLPEEFGVELDVAGFVNTVDITETGGDGEVW